MRYVLGVEDIEDNHWVAWVFALPGCFARGRTEEEAIADAPAQIAAHLAWLESHGQAVARRRGSVEVEVGETFHSYASSDSYLVNAFFEDDRRPLTCEDVEQGLALLEYTRRDLLAILARVPPGVLDPATSGEERSSIPGVVRHIASAEWWYCDRLNMALAREELPADIRARLRVVRDHTRALLPKLVGDDRIVERQGERWSARKVLRRALWHERDHTGQVVALLARQAY